MNFHEVQFPAAISFGSSGGVERRTEIVTLVNGYEERNSPWAHSRRRFDAGLGVRSRGSEAVASEALSVGRAHTIVTSIAGPKPCAPDRVADMADSCARSSGAIHARPSFL